MKKRLSGFAGTTKNAGMEKDDCDRPLHFFWSVSTYAWEL